MDTSPNEDLIDELLNAFRGLLAHNFPYSWKLFLLVTQENSSEAS